MAELNQVSSAKCFGGHQKVYSHPSVACKCLMKFSIYVPPGAEGTVSKYPVIYHLAGLTSTVDSFITKSGFQRYAAEHGVVVVSPDVSPRDTGLPGENDGNPFYGHGAGFYMDAMTPGWKDHYNMFSYVTQELIELVENNFAFVKPGRRGIMGHSMGGHGTILCSLKRPDLYMSRSCLAPVVNASTNAPEMVMYEKYLGPDRELWKQWDPSEVVKDYQGPPVDLLVDIGSCDQHWESLKIWQLVKATKGKENVNLDLHVHAGYNHDYEFVATFMSRHIEYHANILKQ